MKKLVSLLTALMMLCSMSMTAVFAEGEETTTPETMPMRDATAMVSATASYSAWYKNGVTSSNYRWDNYANRLIFVNDEIKELDDYVIEFTNELHTSGSYQFILGGTSDEECVYGYGLKGSGHTYKGMLSVTSTTAETSETTDVELKFKSGSVSQTTNVTLTKSVSYKLYISYADGTIVYGIKAVDADDSTYAWNTASNVDLEGTILAQRMGIVYDETPNNSHLASNEALTVASMYIRKELSASIADGLYDINPQNIAVTFGSTLAETLSETVTVSDGTNSVDCTVERTDDTTATVTIPDGTLAYGTRYCLDLNSITDADGIAAKKLYFRTVDLSTDKYEQVTGVSFLGYQGGTIYEHFAFDDRDKVAVLTKNGENVTVNDFMLSFDYADTRDNTQKYLNVVFGIDPSITTYTPDSMAVENKFNGLAGISLWSGNKYNMYFGNTVNTYHGYASAPHNFFRDGGQMHDLAMANGKTYNVNVTYINKVMTMHVKSSDENVWRKYTKTMSDDYEEIQDGHIAVIIKGLYSNPKNIKLYEPRTSVEATIADAAYDINPGTINVTATYDFGTLPSTVALSDGTNSFDCAIAVSADDTKTAVITIPDNTLAYGTTYTVDLSAAKDFAGVPVANASFTTIANPVPDDMVQMTGVSWKWYLDNVPYKEGTSDYAYNGTNIKMARLMKDGADVKATDFVLTFNYTDNTTETANNTRTLNVVFGVNPETTTYSASAYTKANKFNGLAGISSWNGSKYKLFFGNETAANFVETGGTAHNLVMVKGNTYNFKISYINKVMTLYVKLSTENTWRVYSKTAGDGFTEITDGHIGLIAKLSGSASSTKLYVPVEDYTVVAPSYDKEAVVNGETVTVTASVTKNLDSAVYTSATMITGLYKNVDGTWVLESAVTDTKPLTTGAAVLSKSIEIPAEGTYKLKSFVWNLDNLYPYCDAVEITIAE